MDETNEKDVWSPAEDDMVEINREILKEMKKKHAISKEECRYYESNEREIVKMMNRIDAVDNTLDYTKVFLLVLSVFQRQFAG